MGAIVTDSIVLIFLIIFNGLLAMSEIAIVSARKALLQHRADQGDVGARLALEMAQAPTRFLSTVQIGITLIGILAGAFGGATIAEQLGVYMSRIPVLAPYSEAIGLGIVVLVITYLSLVFGELVPKRVGLNNAERIAASVSKPMRLLSVISSPAVHVLSISIEVVLRLFGARPSSEEPVTEEEIKLMITQSTEAGIFDSAERDMAINVFRLGDRRVSGLMTPRPEIVWVDVNDVPAKIQHQLTTHSVSQFLVCDGSLDHVLGMVRAKDLLATCLTGQALDLRSALRRPLLVPENLPALKVLEMFKQTGNHLAIVFDEHGGTQGLLTHHDIIESIVGDIPSSDLPEESPAVRREDGSWLIDGALPIDEFKRLLGILKLPGEERDDYHTLAGLILMRMGRIPVPGEHFDWNGLYFEVLDMDRYRIDKVLVKPSRQKQ